MKNVKVQFGLEQQGHISYIEETLAKKGYRVHVWREIAEHIGWEVVTAMCYYHDYCEKKKNIEAIAFQNWISARGWEQMFIHDGPKWVNEEVFGEFTTEELYTIFTNETPTNDTTRD